MGGGGEEKSKRKAKKVEKKKFADHNEKKRKRQVEAKVGELGESLGGRGLGGEKTKENKKPKGGKGGDSEFREGFSKNLRGAFN